MHALYKYCNLGRCVSDSMNTYIINVRRLCVSHPNGAETVGSAHVYLNILESSH